MSEILDYPLYRDQRAVLSALLNYVSRGYSWYLVTTSPSHKITNAVYRINAKHHVLANPQDQRLRRVAGVPRARLVLAQQPLGDLWPFALLGDRKLQGERMFHIDAQPLRWLAYRSELGEWVETYQLFRHERTKNFTWYLVDEVHRDLTARAVAAASAHDWTELSRVMRLLKIFPPFRGIHEQLRRIQNMAKHSWGNHRLRTARGEWHEPPWHQFALPKPITPIRVTHFVGENGRPKTLGEWLKKNH